ncbi:dephospho-CoA kinase [Candidatus Erwinia haradaeae]|uniref:Dephospho-CoA kinase n=1 Tax=Candidatus Erwinia haradaeae TaxID=1922217 RepID=A0A451DG85_9GAMM|nr:dephospho-CoA kinase [Candidatus Erwinia haradaeae]VFP85651.1 Dephospho-CoA kinase [Candidatus Erwinia haradaeae]
MSYIVALTGGIGSGKSTIANMFAKLGVDIVDSDVISRQILVENREVLMAIYKYFGKKIFIKDWIVNRSLLRRKIFNSLEDRLWINNLLHPFIYRDSFSQLASSRSSWCLWVVPLLIENNLQYYANRVLLTDVDLKLQITRTAKRDRITYHEVNKIIRAQATSVSRAAIADDVIDNRGSLYLLNQQVISLNQHYLYFSKHV